MWTKQTARKSTCAPPWATSQGYSKRRQNPDPPTEEERPKAPRPRQMARRSIIPSEPRVTRLKVIQGKAEPPKGRPNPDINKITRDLKRNLRLNKKSSSSDEGPMNSSGSSEIQLQHGQRY